MDDEQNQRGKATQRVGEVFSRIRGRASKDSGIEPVTVGPDAGTDDAEMTLLVNRALREELHAAIDGVMDAHETEPRAPMTLKTELVEAVDGVLSDRAGAESLGRRLAVGARGSWARVKGKPQTTDAARDSLSNLLHSAFEGARPGVLQGQVALRRLLPQLMDTLTKMLVEVAGDPVKLERVTVQARRILSRYVSEKTARVMVDVAVRAALMALERRKKDTR